MAWVIKRAYAIVYSLPPPATIVRLTFKQDPSVTAVIMTASRFTVLVRFALFLAVIVTALLTSIGAFAPVRAGMPVLVIAPPWDGGAASVLAQSGGQEIAPVRAPFAVLGVSDHPQDLRHAGAWAVWDATLFAQLCGLGPREDRSSCDAC